MPSISLINMGKVLMAALIVFFMAFKIPTLTSAMLALDRYAMNCISDY
jgi:Sec-independent protein translocase protein TatA